MKMRAIRMFSYVSACCFFALASIVNATPQADISWIPIPLGEEQSTIEEKLGREFSSCVHCESNEKLLVVNAEHVPKDLLERIERVGSSILSGSTRLFLTTCDNKLCAVQIEWLQDRGETESKLRELYGQPSMTSEEGSVRNMTWEIGKDRYDLSISDKDGSVSILYMTYRFD